MIDLNELKEHLSYNEITGDWIRLKSHQYQRIGKTAGTINDKGYRIITFKGKPYKAHILAWFYMTGEFPILKIDHIDRNPDNNKWNNLRLANNQQNRANSKVNYNSITGIKGVRWRADRNRFLARIYIKGKTIYIGSYLTEKEAHEAYLKVAKEHFGEFANGG